MILIDADAFAEFLKDAIKQQKYENTKIDYLEQKKAEIVADHVRRCHDTNLSEAEKIIITQLNWEIEQLNKMKGEQE